MDIGSRIKNLRAEQGLSQEQLAAKLNVTRQTVSNWENNKNYPDFGTMVELSNLFGVSLDELIKGDSGYIKKQQTIERKSITRRRWIIALAVAMVLITAGFGKYIYEFSQGTEDTNNISSYTDIMMSVNLEGQSPSDAISKTYDDITFESMSDKERLKVLESVCDEPEGNIPVVFLDRRPAAEVELLFRHLTYNDIDPEVTTIELYTTDGSRGKPVKRDDLEIDYTVENGRVRFNLCDFINEQNLVLSDKNGNVTNDSLIENCIFVIKYRFGVDEYVSVTAVAVMPDSLIEAAQARTIILNYYKDNDDIEINGVNIIAMEGLDSFQAVAFTDETGHFGIQVLHEENGETVPYLLNHQLPAEQNFYDMSFWDYETGKYYVAAFFRNEVKDLSVEFKYENKDWENERYIYYFTQQDVEAPALFLVSETPKYGNMSIGIEPCP